MPDPNLPLTVTVMIAGAAADDVRVVETRRPNVGEPNDEVHVQLAHGPVAIQLFGPLRDLQLVVVEIVNGLTEIGRVRGLEGR